MEQWQIEVASAQLCDEQTRRTFIESVRAVTDYKTSAIIAGLNPDVVCEWMALGRRRRSGVHFQFLQDALQAEARRKEEAVRVIQRAAQGGDYRAALIFERRYTEEWGEKDPQAVELAMRLQRMQSAHQSFVDELDKIITPDQQSQLGELLRVKVLSEQGFQT